MNEISPEVQTGTIGELLVQVRLLQYGFQAARPLQDSGNDLIAIRGEVFRDIQVKTTKRDWYSKDRLPERYHILAIVQLLGDGREIFLDKSRVFLVPREIVDKISTRCDALEEHLLTQGHVDRLFHG